MAKSNDAGDRSPARVDYLSGSSDVNDLREQVQRLKADNDDIQRKYEIAREEMKKQGAVKAEQQTMLRSWPGVDWSQPAYAVWLMTGTDTPASGRVKVTERGVSHELVFDGGWCVTNSIDSAKRIVRNLKQQYSISEVKQ